nr:translocation/assembly module TamB domain-containing protein [candidate division Zixibacteria bacterium]
MKLRYRLLLAPIVSAFIFFLTTYLAIFHFGLVEYMANRELRKQIGANLPIRVHIGEITGDYYSRLKLEDVFVIYDDGTTIYTMAAVPIIEIRYSLSRFWRGLLYFESIEIDSAILTIKQSTERKWLVPKPLSESKRKEAILDFEIDRFNLRNLSLRLFQPDDTLIFSDVAFGARFRGREKTYTAQIDSLRFKSTDDRLGYLSASGRITLTGNHLMYQDLSVSTDSTDITLNGLLILEDTIQNNCEFEARHLNIAEIASFVNVHLNGHIAAGGAFSYGAGKLEGRIELSGDFMDRKFDSLSMSFEYHDRLLMLDTLIGHIFEGCYLEGHGQLDLRQKPEQYKYIGMIKNFNLDNLANNTFYSDLSGIINLTGSGLKKENLLIDAIVNLDESWFDRYHMHHSIGEMTITTDSLRFYDSFVFKYYDNTITFGGRMDYHGLLEIAGHAAFKNLSVFNGQIFIARMGGRGEADFRLGGLLRNPDLQGIFQSDSLWLYDFYSSHSQFDVNVRRFLYDREGYVNMTLLDGSAYNIPYDTIALLMTLDSQYVFIDSSHAYNRYADIRVGGKLDYYNYPQCLALDDVRVDILGLDSHNADTMVIEIDSLGYDIRQGRLDREEGYIDGRGRINYDQSMNFQIKAAGVEIGPWVALFNDQYNITGRIYGQARLGGNFDKPLIKYRGGIDSLGYQGLNLGNLFADFDYGEQRVAFDSVTLKSREGYYHAVGYYPLDLAFARIDDRFPDYDQNIDILIYDNRFDLVSLLLNEVEDLTGEFKAQFKLTGTPLKPKIDGEASIRKGRLKLYDLVQPLENLRADMKMINHTVYLDSLSAMCENGSGSMGHVGGNGIIQINSIDRFDYDVMITAKEFPIKYELGDITGSVNADLAVRGETPPTVEGDVEIIALTYRENFAAENEGWSVLSALQSENSWDLNLNVEAISNLWIKNDDIDAEFSGNLNFIREQGKYRYIGQMEILRGKGYWADRTFRIEPGATINYEDIEYPNPTLDIYASTRIRATAPSAAGDEKLETTNIDLMVHVTGTLEEPIIATAEGSQYSTEELLSIIFLNDYQTGTNTEQRIGDRLTAGLAEYVGSQVGRIGSRTLGVETFEIDPVYGDKFDPLGTQLTLGVYTLPNLYIYGKSSLSLETGREFGFEYRLQKFLMMEGRIEENNLYRLILNFNWNY